MGNGFRSLAPIWCIAGLVILVDQLTHVVLNAWPLQLGAEMGRFQLAFLVASRVSATLAGLTLIAAGALQLEHRGLLMTWAALAALLVLAAIGAGVIAVALGAPPPRATGQSGPSIAAVQIRVIITAAVTGLLLPLVIRKALSAPKPESA